MGSPQDCIATRTTRTSIANNSLERRGARACLAGGGARGVAGGTVHKDNIGIYSTDPGIVELDGGEQVRSLYAILEQAGYHMASPQLLDTSEFGIPQNRKRVFIIGSRKKEVTWALEKVNKKQRSIDYLQNINKNLQNTETQDLLDLIGEFAEHSFVLIKGNHDVDIPEHSALEVVGQLAAGPFLCLHEPPGSNFDQNIPFDLDLIQSQHSNSFLLCGHLHPGATLRGKGRGHIKMKAFFFNAHLGVLPAFGPFTGVHALQEQGQYYGIAEGRILPLF